MIIKSEFKTFFFWFSSLCLALGVYGLIFTLFGGFSNETTSGQVALSVVLLLLIVLYGKMLWDAKAIIIDVEGKSITFKNRYTTKENTYPFDFFDGYVTSYQHTKFGSYKVIHFVKDGRLMYKVSRAIYSNQDKMIEVLSSIKDLGPLDYSFIDSIRSLFGKKVLTK